MKFAAAILASVATALYTDGAEADRVSELPEMGKFEKYGAFSGYLDIADTTKKIHYLFFEAQNNSADAPVLIWFNGGPGCSSMLGFMQENGPFRVESGDTKFHESEFAWNKETNLLYIEQPAGVGYSYCNSKKDCTFDDKKSGKDNLDVVLTWFDRFPQFKQNELYVSGESYGGVYVPYLTYNLYEYGQEHKDDDDVFKPNIKGFAVGNGVTNWEYDTQAAYIDMSYWHSLISEEMHESLDKEQCDWNMPYMLGVSDQCMSLNDEFSTLTSQVNVYDIYGTCWGLGPFPQAERGFPHLYKGGKSAPRQPSSYADYTPWIHGGKMRGGAQSNELPPCTFGSTLLDYMNSDAVREAMHIPDYVQAWDLCQSASTWTYVSQPEASQWIYEKLANTGIKMLHYSGDTDGAVPTVGTQNWIASLNWNKTSEWTQYLVEGQVAGYWESYEGGLTFGTVHGAGHMAPQFKPPQTYHLVMNWLFNRDI
jgi:carboxypeptidase C (cathepsin A)